MVNRKVSKFQLKMGWVQRVSYDNRYLDKYIYQTTCVYYEYYIHLHIAFVGGMEHTYFFSLFFYFFLSLAHCLKYNNIQLKDRTDIKM